MAKSGDKVALPFGTLVAVLETGLVHVKVPVKTTGHTAEDFKVLEFDQDILQFIVGDTPENPIVIKPGEPGSPENPIVIPGHPSHPIAITPPVPTQPPAKPE